MKQPFGRSLSEASLDNQRRILAFSAIAEGATGLALMFDPAIVAGLLVGPDLSGVGAVLGRCFGIALVALGLACWPGAQRAEGGSPACRAIAGVQLANCAVPRLPRHARTSHRSSACGQPLRFMHWWRCR